MQAFYQVIIVTVMTKITSEDGFVSLVEFLVSFIYLKSKSAAAYKIGYDHFFKLLVKNNVVLDKIHVISDDEIALFKGVVSAGKTFRRP